MNRRKLLIYPSVACIAAALSFAAWTAPVRAQAQNYEQSGSQAQLTKEVQKKLGGLPYADVFDWLVFKVQGSTVVLEGYASRPIVKSDAEKAVKGIRGIETVDNQIKVLPYLGLDDRIRRQVYDSIYTSAPLRIYNANQGALYRGPSVARAAGGITNDPPLGFHAIHIIVDHGHVTLYGVVNSASDSALAKLKANSVPGVFSVTNDLVVGGNKR